MIVPEVVPRRKKQSPRVMIVGAGFGGAYCARAFRRSLAVAVLFILDPLIP